MIPLDHVGLIMMAILFNGKQILIYTRKYKLKQSNPE